MSNEIFESRVFFDFYDVTTAVPIATTMSQGQIRSKRIRLIF
jgi:hypothetical protein